MAKGKKKKEKKALVPLDVIFSRIYFLWRA